MKWTELNFGKHNGRTLPKVIFSDPCWFFWAMGKEVFGNSIFKAQADNLYYKATHILIPNYDEGDLVAEYYTHQPTGKFSHFNIVTLSRPVHRGSSPTKRSAFIDMSVPWNMCRNDNLGYKNFMMAFKIHIIGDRSVRFTRKFCESYFNNPVNFA